MMKILLNRNPPVMYPVLDSCLQHCYLQANKEWKGGRSGLYTYMTILSEMRMFTTNVSI